MTMEEPRKPQNAYWIYLSENRDAITKEAGSGSAPVVGKLAGSKWKVMSAAAKAPYEKKAADGKAQFEKDLEKFKAQGGVVGKRKADKKEAKSEVAAKRAKKVRDPTKPKRPTSSYWLWLNENRAAISAETGGKDVAKVAKVAGERWKKLDATTKAPYEKKAVDLQATYKKAMAEWRKIAGADAVGDDDEDEDEEQDDQ